MASLSTTPIGRGFGVHISTNALEQMEVITGGFNAEHGDAQSGVLTSLQKLDPKILRESPLPSRAVGDAPRGSNIRPLARPR